MAIKESTHWYDKAGKPCYEVERADGKGMRNTTLRDARKLNLFPSVTSVIKVAAAPGLENWKLNQALMSALTLPQGKDESLDDFMKRAKKDSKEQGIKAAERGTEIHADIEKGFSKGVDSIAYTAVQEALELLLPHTVWIAEDSFSSKAGYGGKIDLYSHRGVVVDFKSKDGLTKDSDPSKLVYDEHGMQLSAYAHGLEFESPRRTSVFVDRKDPSIVLTHIWDLDSHEKHLGMFRALLEYWMLSKGYRPGVNDD